MEKIAKKRGRPRKIDKEVKAEEPKAEEPKTLETPIPETCYKEEIVVLGKKVKRLNDGKDTDLQFHCSVNDGEYTAHFDKESFK